MEKSTLENMKSTLEKEKSTHVVEVVPISLEPHPNADTLSLVRIYDYICIVKTEQFKNISLGAWIPPDSVIDRSRPEFATFPRDRVRAEKIRGVISYGLLIPAPENAQLGDNVADQLCVTHYEPIPRGDPRNKKDKLIIYEDSIKYAPQGTFYKYDVDSFMKYNKKVFVDNEPCIITEKVHGSNARFVYTTEQFCGSRINWKKKYITPKPMTFEQLLSKVKDEAKAKEIYERVYVNPKPNKSPWWKVYEDDESIGKFCEKNPGYCLYGEIYGDVQTMKYNCKKDQIFFRAFDILSPSGTWLDWPEFKEMCENVKIVPIINENFRYDFNQALEYANGKSLIAEHIREGCVIKTKYEKHVENFGRACLKVINPEYLLMKG